MMPFIFSLSETLYRNDQSIHFSYCLHSGLDVCITFKSVILTNLFCYKVSLNSNICVTESDWNLIVVWPKKVYLPCGHISWNLRQESETQMSILSIKTVYFGHDLKDDIRHSKTSIDVFCKRVCKFQPLIVPNFTTSVFENQAGRQQIAI